MYGRFLLYSKNNRESDDKRVQAMDFRGPYSQPNPHRRILPSKVNHAICDYQLRQLRQSFDFGGPTTHESRAALVAIRHVICRT